MPKKRHSVELTQNKTASEIRVELYQELKSIREEQGLSQKEAGETVGISRMEYSRQETGKRTKLNQFIALARAMGIKKIVLERD